MVLSIYNDGVYNAGIYNIVITGPTLSGSEVSVTVDGKGQYLGRISPGELGIANTWTLGFWAKTLANKEHVAIFSTAGISNTNEISITATPLPAGTSVHGKPPAELRVFIKDTGGTTIKSYGWGDYFQDDVWSHVFLQWDGADLTAFKNGIPTTTGAVFTNTAGVMSDSPGRKLFYGSATAGAVATFSGLLGHFGMWDSILSPAEMNSVVSGGFEIDLTAPSGSYVSIGSLQHYYRPGFVAEALGQDFVGDLTLDKQRNLDVTNVILDKP